MLEDTDHFRRLVPKKTWASPGFAGLSNYRGVNRPNVAISIATPGYLSYSYRTTASWYC